MSDIIRPSSQLCGEDSSPFSSRSGALGRSLSVTAGLQSSTVGDAVPSPLDREAIAAEACRWFMSDAQQRQNAATIAALQEKLASQSEASSKEVGSLQQSLHLEREVSKSAVNDLRVRLDMMKSTYEQRIQDLQRTMQLFQQENTATGKEATRLDTLLGEAQARLGAVQKSSGSLETRVESVAVRLGKVEAELEEGLTAQAEDRAALDEQIEDLKKAHAKEKGEILRELSQVVVEATQESRGKLRRETAALCQSLCERSAFDGAALDFVKELMTRKDDLVLLLDKRKHGSTAENERHEAGHGPQLDHLDDEAPPRKKLKGQPAAPSEADRSQDFMENAPDEPRWQAFFSHFSKTSKQYKDIQPSKTSDTRFIWGFIQGVEDPCIRDFVQDRLLEEYPDLVSPVKQRDTRSRNLGKKITFRKLTWAQAVAALEKTVFE